MCMIRAIPTTSGDCIKSDLGNSSGTIRCPGERCCAHPNPQPQLGLAACEPPVHHHHHHLHHHHRHRHHPAGGVVFAHSRSNPQTEHAHPSHQVLAHNAVHAAFSGYTGLTVGLVNTHYCYLPIPVVISAARK
jgi:hypothetical protein